MKQNILQYLQKHICIEASSHKNSVSKKTKNGGFYYLKKAGNKYSKINLFFIIII